MIQGDGTLVMGTKLCILTWDDLKREILNEAHSSAYAMYPRNTKVYHTLREFHWWLGMKNEIVEFMARCLVCQ